MVYPPIIQLLPHQGSAVLLAEILAAQGERLTARVKPITPGESPVILIEAAAQAVAVLLGLRQAGAGQQPGPGYLAAVRDFRWLLPAEDNGSLVADVREIKSLPPLYSFSAEIRQSDRLLAIGTLTVAAGGA